MRISDWSSDVCSSDLLRSSSTNPKPTTSIDRIHNARMRLAAVHWNIQPLQVPVKPSVRTVHGAHDYIFHSSTICSALPHNRQSQGGVLRWKMPQTCRT